jgi:hypothetical protein
VPVAGVQQKTFLQLLQSATGAAATTAAATAQAATVQAQVSCISHHQQPLLHMLLTSSNANPPWPQQQQQQQGRAASPVSLISSWGPVRVSLPTDSSSSQAPSNFSGSPVEPGWICYNPMYDASHRSSTGSSVASHVAAGSPDSCFGTQL